MPVRPLTGRADRPPIEWPGERRSGVSTTTVPREVAARNGEALMRRHSVTVHCETASAARAGAAGRINRYRSKRLIALDGGWANDGHVGDEFQAVVTWR